MDEVKTMAQAGETMGRAVGTGLRTIRRGAEQVAAAAAEGLDKAGDIRDHRAEIVETGRRARKQLAHEARLTAKEVAKSAKQARKTARTALAVPGDLVAAATPKQRRRRWPWLLGLGIAAAGAGTAYVLKSRQPAADTEPVVDTAVPETRREDQVDGQPAPIRQG